MDIFYTFFFSFSFFYPGVVDFGKKEKKRSFRVTLSCVVVFVSFISLNCIFIYHGSASYSLKIFY